MIQDDATWDDNASYRERTANGTVFVKSDVDIFGMACLVSALRMYAKCGMKASRNHTPKNMLSAAKQYTGLTYKRGEYLRAAQDVEDGMNRLKRLPRKEVGAETLTP